MSRVGLVYYTPSCLLEDSYYDSDTPHYLHWRDFKSPYYSPLHYSETVEIILFRDVKCNIRIGGKSYVSTGKACFLIPPNVVHDVAVEKGDGLMYVFHCNFEFLDQYINLKHILNKASIDLQQLHYQCSHIYDEVLNIFEDLIRYNDNIFARMRHLLSLFELLSQNVDERAEIDNKLVSNSDHIALQSLLNWTNKNFDQKISLDTVSEMMFFNKYYFCKWFKRLTGVPYHQYLNQLRITRSYDMLKGGCAVSVTAEACGFTNTSHFIQLFKNTVGCTPKVYMLEYQNMLVTEHQ